MKLYASVTSERATKGQGGKYLIIDVQNEQKEKILNLHIYQTADGSYVMRGSDYGMSVIKIDNSKGEKEKSEHDCPGCGATRQTIKGLCPSCKGIPEDER